MRTDTVIDPTRVTVRPSSLLEAWIVALESGEFTQCAGQIFNDAGERCAWGVLYAVMERAGLSEAEQLDQIWAVGSLTHATARLLGYFDGGIDWANDDGVSLARIGAALRQAGERAGLAIPG